MNAEIAAANGSEPSSSVDTADAQSVPDHNANGHSPEADPGGLARGGRRRIVGADVAEMPQLELQTRTCAEHANCPSAEVQREKIAVECFELGDVPAGDVQQSDAGDQVRPKGVAGDRLRHGDDDTAGHG